MLNPADMLHASILIVDDKEANVVLLEQMLRGAGYANIASTQDPRAVSALYREHRHDLILLDLVMPDLDGFQVMAGLREVDPDAYLPILAITVEPAHKLRALKAGARDFISKPFDLAELLLRVRHLLEVGLLLRHETGLNHARLENSQRIAGLGDWEYDFASRRLLWSEEVYRIIGIARRDHPPNAETFYLHVHPDDLAMVHREKKAAGEGTRRVDFEHRLIRPDGAVRYIHQVTGMIFDELGQPLRESGTIQDITERKVAEAALRLSEERFRKLIMNSPDGHFVHVDGRITLVNRAFCQLLGATEPAQLLGRPAIEAVHPDCREAALVRQQNVLVDKPIPPAEMKFVRLDGTAVEVEVNAVAFDVHGQREVQVIVRDLSVRRQAEHALQQEQALLSSLISTIPDHIYFKDRHSRFVRINDSMAQRIGLRGPAEAIGKTDADFFTSEHAHTTFQQEQRLMATGEAIIGLEEKETWTHGLVTWASTTKMALRNPAGEIVGLIGVSRDITANKAAGLALRESEERFRFVARAVSDVVWDWDLVSDTLWWNDGFLTTFGYAAGEIVPSVASWTKRIHPEDGPRVVVSMRAAIDAGAETWAAEYRVERKDGSYAAVEDRGYILRNATGQGVRMVGGLRDLTEQKKMETQYLRAQRLESIGTLAGGIAHDLNNVLAPIMLSIELLKADAGDNPRRLTLLDVIYNSSRRGTELVRQVLSFALGQDGRRVALRLRQLIDELVAILSETLPRQIRIVSDVAANLWTVKGDPTQLHQVLLNLAVNARDAMPQGGTLTLTAANITIDAQFAATSQWAKAGPYVVLQVTDSGVGIPADVREQIFDPFFTTKELGKGTGLGLATVHTVVKSHGGFLNVESKVGSGSTFSVYLPAEPALVTEEPGPHGAAELPRGRDELILVVDDEPAIRDITKRTLEMFGYRVVTACDGAEAVALYARKTEPIALVLTDMMMPVMDGFATIQVLMRLNPAVRIIVASGSGSGKNATKVKAVGVKDFLPKPYEAETLLQLVREVLDRPAPPAAR